MKNATWLEALDHELAARGIPPQQCADIMVETEGFLLETDEAPMDQFGSPAGYADTVAAALQPGRHRRAPGPPVIEVDGLHRSFGSRSVLADLSLTVGAGNIVALTGANGAGKSTLLRILAGLDRPDEGSVRVKGPVGYAPQDGGLNGYLRPTEHFELFGSAMELTRREARAEGLQWAEQLGWAAESEPTAMTLSGGTRQKLSVVLALLGDPDVLLLDEPYQGMDPESTRKFWELMWSLGDRNQSAVVSSHSGDALSRVDAVIEIERIAP